MRHLIKHNFLHGIFSSYAPYHFMLYSLVSFFFLSSFTGITNWRNDILLSMNLFGFLRLNLFYMASPWHRRPYNTIWTYLQKVMSTRQALARISNFKNVYTFLTATNKTPFNALHCYLFFSCPFLWFEFHSWQMFD